MDKWDRDEGNYRDGRERKACGMGMGWQLSSTLSVAVDCFGGRGLMMEGGLHVHASTRPVSVPIEHPAFMRRGLGATSLSLLPISPTFRPSFPPCIPTSSPEVSWTRFSPGPAMMKSPCHPCDTSRGEEGGAGGGGGLCAA